MSQLNSQVFFPKTVFGAHKNRTKRTEKEYENYLYGFDTRFELLKM